jgi:hypothetical protein
MPGVARRLVTFLLRQKSNEKRRTRRATFYFYFFVAAIFVGKRAPSTNSLEPSIEI